MPKQLSEAAYYASRIEVSMAQALASADSCARASHNGIAQAYRARLAVLAPSDFRQTVVRGLREGQALARWDNEGGAIAWYPPGG